MIKKIVLFLIAFINTINSMDQQPSILTLISQDTDLLWSLTEQLCVVHNWKRDTKTSFKNLCLTNRSLHSYYTDENMQQKIIDCFKNYYKQNPLPKSPNANNGVIPIQISLESDYKSSLGFAILLSCNNIRKKIIDLHQKIINKDLALTEQDLSENNAWYLNSSTLNCIKEQKSLWDWAIETGDVEKCKVLITRPYIQLPFAPLSKIIPLMSKVVNGSKSYNAFVEIFTIVLNKTIFPDERRTCSENTALMWAVSYNKKEIARLLLQHNANPFLVYYFLYNNKSSTAPYAIYDEYNHMNTISHNPKLKNAFLLEAGESKGWLMQMYKEIQQSKLMQ